jgi:hypothetical protein
MAEGVGLGAEFWTGAQYHLKKHYLVGLTPMLRYRLLTDSRWTPILDAGAGVATTDIGRVDLRTVEWEICRVVIADGSDLNVCEFPSVWHDHKRSQSFAFPLLPVTDGEGGGLTQFLLVVATGQSARGVLPKEPSDMISTTCRTLAAR